MIIEKIWVVVDKIGEKTIATIKRIDNIVDVITDKLVDTALRTFDDDDDYQIKNAKKAMKIIKKLYKINSVRLY